MQLYTTFMKTEGVDGMGKYAPLKMFLIEQGRDHVPMTFAEIERILNLRLPASKQYPAWWSNNPSNNTMTREWLDAGYQTEAVDIAGKKLVFRRVRQCPPTPAGPSGAPPSRQGGGDSGVASGRHPIFGSMKGTLTILPGVDLSEPADPDWGRVYED
jgi:hypothetical protein